MAESSYTLGRGYLASVRLYAQHWMWRYQLGYLLHPLIPQHDGNLKIADVACGTGVWLIEAARTLPPSTQLDGYDISPKQYPPSEWLPKNIRLQTLDMMAPIPEELVGFYDVVHVGLVVMVVLKENPVPMLKNLMALLKPGGYLQWDESDMSSLNVTPSDGVTPHPRFDEYCKYWAPWRAARGLTWNWASQIDKVVAENGLELLYYERFPIQDEIKKPWTDTQVTSAVEQIQNGIVPTFTDGQEPSREKWLEIADGLVMELQQGQSLTMDMIVTVARKPES